MASVVEMLSCLTVCCVVILASTCVDAANVQSRRRRPKSTPTPAAASGEPVELLDVALVIGTSATVGSEDNWELVLVFVKQLVIMLRVDPSQTNVALLTFGDNATLHKPLGQTSNTLDITEDIDSIGFTQGRVNLNDALIGLRHIIFTDSRARPAARKVAIIITDTEDNVPSKGNSETLRHAKMCKEDGIRLIIVGIAHDKHANVKRWRKIVSDPKTDLVKFSKFDQLRDANKIVFHLLRPQPDGSGTMLCLPSVQNFEVIFVVGSSKTLAVDGDSQDANWRVFLDYCTRDLMNPVMSGSRFGFVSFGDTAVTHLKLHEHRDYQTVFESILSVQYVPGERNLNDALHLLWTYSFTAEGGSRPGSTKLAYILTDGEDNVPEKGTVMTLANATLCKAHGIRLEMFVVPHIKEDINVTRWMQIADALHVVDTFEDLKDDGVRAQRPTLSPPRAKKSSLMSYKYQLTVFTACSYAAGTSSNISIEIFDEEEQLHHQTSGVIPLCLPNGGFLTSGSIIQFDIQLFNVLSNPIIAFKSDRQGPAPEWLLNKVVLQNAEGTSFFYLECRCWINDYPVERQMQPVDKLLVDEIMKHKC